MLDRNKFKECPRCGNRSFEVLSDYGHCPDCLYIEDRWIDFDAGYREACKIEEDLQHFKPNKKQNRKIKTNCELEIEQTKAS